MLAQGASFKCQSCQSQVEVISAPRGGGPLVCCEVEMKSVGDEFDKLWENEAYDEMDNEWD